MKEAELVWQEPMHLEMSALTTIKDTRPLLAIFDNVRSEQDWIDKLLVAEDLAGHVELSLDGKRAVLSDAMLGSEQIKVGLKGRADPSGREAMFYVRWHDLTGAMEVQGDDHYFNLINARSRFDAYVPGQMNLASSRDGTTAQRPDAGTQAVVEKNAPSHDEEARTPLDRSSPEANGEAAGSENLFLD